MKKFELCYALDEEHILVPDLLAVAEPKLEIQRAGALEFRYHYNFLPKSIMPRFMVKRHRDIKKDLRWRTGVMLEDKDCDATALVKADEREQDILIIVTGTRKRDYFAVEYRELLGFEEAGRDEIFIGKVGKAYSVAQLLSGIEKPEEPQRRRSVSPLFGR
jgi:hypothetical protein